MESRMQEVIRPDGSVVTYEVSGSGAPVLLLAPSGISSAATEWGGYFIDPRILADDFTVISMDQRYAGAGRAPLEPFSHESVFADQLAVLDALEFPDAAVIGADFYCASALKFACDAPARTRATVLVEPMGLDDSNSPFGWRGLKGWMGLLGRQQTILLLPTTPRQGPGASVCAVNQAFRQRCVPWVEKATSH